MAEANDANQDAQEPQDPTEQAQSQVDDALASAQASLDEMKQDVANSTAVASSAAAQAASGDASPVDVPDLDQQLGNTPTSIDLLGDVDLHVQIELGRTEMLVEDVLRLGDGAVVELDKLAGDPVDVFVNNQLIARGEVLVLNDNFCIRISEIVADLETQAQAAAEAEVATAE